MKGSNMKDGSVWKTRETLLEKIKDKYDDASWEDFVYYYKKYIYNIIRSMNVSHHDADEITQKVILKAWDKLPEFKYDPGKGRFRGWLCMVTGNEVKDFFRSRKKEMLMSDLDPQGDNKDVEFEDLGNITLPEIEKIAEKEWRTYISKLAWTNIADTTEEKMKDCFLMMTEGKTPKEISEKLGISESSTYVYKKRVQDKLRAEIMRLNKQLL